MSDLFRPARFLKLSARLEGKTRTFFDLRLAIGGEAVTVRAWRTNGGEVGVEPTGSTDEGKRLNLGETDRAAAIAFVKTQQ